MLVVLLFCNGMSRSLNISFAVQLSCLSLIFIVLQRLQESTRESKNPLVSCQIADNKKTNTRLWPFLVSEELHFVLLMILVSR